MAMSLKGVAFMGLALAASRAAVASPFSDHTVKHNGTCTSLNQRKAWSALTDTEKSEYIKAELCLMNSPTKLDIEGAKNRWDELAYGHIVQSNVIHDVGAFLPWHRLYMRAHEVLLQTECNYTGAQPYWDELSDVTNGLLNQSSVFDVNTGFGNGDLDGDGCITTGPFVNLTLHLTQTSTNASYCLTRNLTQDSFYWANSTHLDECMATTTYEEAWNCFISFPHTAGHASVGGTMLDVVASPSDPLFFLHHTYLDRVWWQWQKMNLTARLTEMSGRNVPTESYLEGNNFDYPSTAILDYDGDNGNITTLNHNLWMVGLINNHTVGEVMDLNGDVICAEYVG